MQEAYRGAMGEQRTRYDMEDGSAVDIRRWKGQPFLYNFSWDLPTYEIAQIFEAWVEYTLQDGSEYVDMPVMGRTVRCRAVGQAPQYTPTATGWRASMQFQEIQRGPIAYAGYATWPVNFPLFDRENFTLLPTKGVEKSEITTGVMQMRRRFRERHTMYSGRMLMDLTTRDAFWTFYKDALQDGLAYFRAPFAGTYGESSLRARITDTPEEQSEGSHFWITMTLETVNAPIMTRSEYYLKAGEYVDDYFVTGFIVDNYIGRVIIP